MLWIDENDVPETAVPGRYLRWLVGPSGAVQSELCAFCVMRVEPGKTVRPAHSHPGEEELVYCLEGSGEVFVDGEIAPFQAGNAVLFPRKSVHIVKNSGFLPMKVACFFAPPCTLSGYKMHPEIDFPGDQ